MRSQEHHSVVIRSYLSRSTVPIYKLGLVIVLHPDDDLLNPSLLIQNIDPLCKPVENS